MKSDRATVKRRIDEVLSLRMLGAMLTDIRQYAAEQTPPWNVSDRELYRYIAASDTLLAEQLEKDRDKNLNRHLAQRRLLYARSMAVSDYRTALSVACDEAKLLDLYPAERKHVTGDVTVRILRFETLPNASNNGHAGNGQSASPAPERSR